MFEFDEKKFLPEEREVLRVMRQSYYEIQPKMPAPLWGFGLASLGLMAWQLYAFVIAPDLSKEGFWLAWALVSVIWVAILFWGGAERHIARLSARLSDAQLDALVAAGLSNTRIHPLIQEVLLATGGLSLRDFEDAFYAVLRREQKNEALQMSPAAQRILAQPSGTLK